MKQQQRNSVCVCVRIHLHTKIGAECHRACLQHFGQDRPQGNITVVRPLVVAPTEMEPQAIRRDIPYGPRDAQRAKPKSLDRGVPQTEESVRGRKR